MRNRKCKYPNRYKLYLDNDLSAYVDIISKEYKISKSEALRRLLKLVFKGHELKDYEDIVDFGAKICN